MSCPQYFGKVEHIASSVDTKGYFHETPVAEWDLADFLLSGQNKDIFRAELQQLSRCKAVPRDVQGFARALATFYSIKQNIVIATNSAETELNRRALKGFEQRVVQSNLQADLVAELEGKQAGASGAASPSPFAISPPPFITSSSSTRAEDSEPDAIALPDYEEEEGQSTHPALDDDDNEDEVSEELAMVASCTPFAHLVKILYEKHGHTFAQTEAPVPFPTDTTNGLYTYAKVILDRWESATKIEQKECLVALSGIVNTLGPVIQEQCAIFSTVADQCLQEGLFTISKAQESIFSELKERLGDGTTSDLRGLRRYCSRCRDDLEEAYDNGDWSPDKADAMKEQLQIMQIMAFICEEIISMKRVSKTSEHEDVFVWRGLARILYEHDLVVRVGELGSTSTREDRLVVESEFGLTDHNVRGRKIDIMHQLCLEGNSKPVEMIAWEAKSEAVGAEALQIQLRKNIRINASIMNKLSGYMGREFPRPSPWVLDIVGPRALVYTVRKIEPGVFGAGAVGDKMIELPTNASEIAGFLDGGSMSALLRIGVHNSEFACLLRKGYRRSLSDEIMAQMTGRASLKKEGPPVIFTPKKKQKQKHKKP
ncbi:hypothetical protein BGZ68_008850 [Mortierella alpina]|nr:hypothetical protein BGZ68_008850 [Mortierella alpina]